MSPLQKTGGLLALSIVLLAAWTMGIADDDKPSGKDDVPPKAATSKKDLSHFMRLKLEASSKLLEGLAIEDYAMIKEGAKQLNKMSTEEKWRVTNDAVYRNFSGEFQQTTKELMDAADNENLDRAALKWMDATMCCIECHRYARGVLVTLERSAPNNSSSLK